MDLIFHYWTFTAIRNDKGGFAQLKVISNGRKGRWVIHFRSTSSTRKLSPVKYSIFQTHAGSTLKMRFPLVLLSLFALNGVKSFPLNSSNSRARQCQKPPVNNCNCQCTVNQNTVHLTDAMRSMEAKLDNLISLVNNISSNPQPAKKPGNQKNRC